MELYNLADTYKLLLSFDKNFFSSLSQSEFNTCEKVADYFLGQRTDIDREDLGTLQAQIDRFRQKKWTAGQTQLKEEALEGIYRKFHPERLTIADLPSELLLNFILPEAAAFQTTNLVCRRWATLFKTDTVWKRVAEIIECPPLQAFPGEWHLAVKDDCREYVRYIARLRSLPPHIQELLKGEMTTEKMVQLKGWAKRAPDTVAIWRVIVRTLNLPMPQVLENMIMDLVEKALHFPQWLDENEAHLRELKTLDLHGLGLTSLPSEIGRLIALIKLDVANNKLTTLPPEIKHLTALKHLFLTDNKLKTLPPEIGCLTELKTLYLLHNQLITLPPEIGRLTQLTHLLASKNKLTTLPSEIGGLSALKVLELYDNELEALPSEIGRLAALTTLELKDNKLITLPPEIESLTALTLLDVSDNEITFLPPEIGGLISLTIFSVSYNQLTLLPPEIGNLPLLDRFFLSHNKLTRIPSEIGRLGTLTYLSLSDNEITSLPPDMGDLTKLQTLVLRNNQLTTLPSEMERLVKLDIDCDYKQLTRFSPEGQERLRSLRRAGVSFVN